MNLDLEVGRFVQKNTTYYQKHFRNVQESNGFSWNTAAFLFGPLWAAGRHLRLWFWLFLIFETLAITLIGLGTIGDLGTKQQSRLEALSTNQTRLIDKASVAGLSPTKVASLERRISGLETMIQKLKQELDILKEHKKYYLIFGFILFLLLRALQGLYSNKYYEQQYRHWLASEPQPETGFSIGYILLGVALSTTVIFGVLASYVQSWFIPDILHSSVLQMPIDKSVLFSGTAQKIDSAFEFLALNYAHVFDSVVWVLDTLVESTEFLLLKTPWPILCLLILTMAYQLAGMRVTLVTGVSLAYLICFGLWETSLITIALLGVASLLCLCIGIPLGVWFGKNPRLYQWNLPVLDFMQTMPAFVYLIPIIAFFGTGKPPGIIATLIFGMPPVIRLTALGIQNVPKTTKEAAIAFGASPWRLLRDVEFPIAMPSILAGINQTLLMCLSMVVIASLIGAKGLGQDVLVALQYAAKGQGLLAGLAILCCALIIDRIVRGALGKQ